MTPRTEREAFGIRLGQVARLWRAEIDRRLSSHGLTQARWSILLHLSRLDKPATQAMLAAAAGVQEPTLVRLLDSLEAEGLIEREPIAGDRRAKSIRMTRRATPSLGRIRKIAGALRDEIFEGIDAADIDACLRVLEHLGSKLRGARSNAQGARRDAPGKTRP